MAFSVELVGDMSVRTGLFESIGHLQMPLQIIIFFVVQLWEGECDFDDPLVAINAFERRA
jgi:hypothetical protein